MREFYKGKTSPHWYDSDSFYELLKSAKDRSVRDVVSEFDGCSVKSAKLAKDFKRKLAKDLNRDEADSLLISMCDVTKAVDPKRFKKKNYP